MPDAETGKAMQVLGLLLEYFGEQGERWTRDRYDDGDGRRCLVGALSYLRGKHRVPSESAECFLHEAMKQGPPYRRGGLAMTAAGVLPSCARLSSRPAPSRLVRQIDNAPLRR